MPCFWKTSFLQPEDEVHSHRGNTEDLSFHFQFFLFHLKYDRSQAERKLGNIARKWRGLRASFEIDLLFAVPLASLMVWMRILS